MIQINAVIGLIKQVIPIFPAILITLNEISQMRIILLSTFIEEVESSTNRY